MLEISGLQKVIDRNTVLEVGALTVAAGEVAAIIETSGSGKTVLVDLLTGRSRPTAGTIKVPGRSEDGVVLLNPADILYASTEQGQTGLHTADDHFPTHFTLAELEQRLARSGFFRAHRGYLVNLQHVKAVIPYTRDSFTLVLNDPAGSEIPLSKTAARELRDLLGY